jgi:uncharacterized iron-regulated membrane protein
MAKLGTKKQVNVAVGILAVLGALVVVGGFVEWIRQRRGSSVSAVSLASAGENSDAVIEVHSA